MKVDQLRKDFPLFDEHNKDKMVYFDSAATAQVPYVVIDAMQGFYTQYKANVDRGIYKMAEKATTKYEQAREVVANFIGADTQEIIFTSGTTASINLVVQMWAQHYLQKGDEIIISEVEHHSNLLPWQQFAKGRGCAVKIIPVDDDGLLDMQAYEQAITKKTKLVSIVHSSNILGTTNDVKTICSIAHKVGAKVLIDAAQSIAHQKIDVTDLDCDFLAFSGHKLFGPTGIGILYGKKKLLQEAKPFMFGGSMVFTAGYEDSFWKNAPYCFEAGTAPIAQAIGLAAAITYIQNHIDFDWLQEHENMLVQKSVFGILESGMKLLSPATAGKHNHLVTFYHPTIHAHDIAMYLDVYCNIAVRAGNHCVQPYHEKKDIEATVRASFALYNTEKEVDQFVRALKTIQ